MTWCFDFGIEVIRYEEKFEQQIQGVVSADSCDSYVIASCGRFGVGHAGRYA